nr:MAG TPA: Replicative helicase [Caudoviricetes sp.]
MEPLIKNLPESILTALTSDYCTKHKDAYGNEMKVQMMDMSQFGMGVICPQCELDKENAKVIKSITDEAIERERNKRKNTLHYRSVFSDESIKDAGFKNYETRTAEERKNKDLALKAVAHYKSGKTFTTMLKGDTGVGKSHLAMAIVRNLNAKLDTECAFINVRRMLMMIKNSFNDEESPYTQMYFIDLLARVEFLVLDDLGNESGDKEATRFVSEVLTEVLESRQKKAMIVTTNFSREQLERIYSKPLISRLLKGAAIIKFEETTDKRVKPFDLNQEVEG